MQRRERASGARAEYRGAYENGFALVRYENRKSEDVGLALDEQRILTESTADKNRLNFVAGLRQRFENVPRTVLSGKNIFFVVKKISEHGLDQERSTSHALKCRIER